MQFMNISRYDVEIITEKRETIMLCKNSFVKILTLKYKIITLFWIIVYNVKVSAVCFFSRMAAICFCSDHSLLFFSPQI